jgi:GNAT superfamily N-acetyltransferase
MDSPRLHVRAAVESDCRLLLELIRELACFERLEHEVQARPEDIRAALFGSPPTAEALIGLVDGQEAGFALFFTNFSTFVGRPGIYLEDLYVRPAYRRAGLGRRLLLEVAQIAHQRECGRMDWTVLAWNSDAIAFYEQIGAQVLPDWRVSRLDRTALARLSSATLVSAPVRREC